MHTLDIFIIKNKSGMRQPVYCFHEYEKVNELDCDYEGLLTRHERLVDDWYYTL